MQVLILSEKLHSVTSQFDKLRAIRFQDIISKAVPRRKPNQINKPRSANTFAYNGTELREPDNFEHQPVRAQQQLLDDETRALQVIKIWKGNRIWWEFDHLLIESSFLLDV